jgi:hypothetical protein
LLCRLVSASVMWTLFATFIMCRHALMPLTWGRYRRVHRAGTHALRSLGLRMTICEPMQGEDGVFVLTADRTVRCGESPKLWLLHIVGACIFFGMPRVPKWRLLLLYGCCPGI